MQRAVLCLVLACLSAAPCAAEPLTRREDASVFARDGRLLYRETHWSAGADDPRRLVLYRCADGRPFARKRVLAQGSPQAPDFELVDARDGYREGVRTRNGRREVLAGEAVDNPAGVPLDVPGNGVIDAGFDAAVRRHWDRLMAGETVRLQFLMPSRQRFYPVRVQRDTGLDWQGVPAERLRMQLDLWFGFVVPPIMVTYARDDQRLLEFAGTGNLRDVQQDYPQVRIAFAPQRARASAGEVAAARNVALAGQCRF
ncbi:hypothetical protein [Arenimonas daejeonensis]|uniref:hypothetical protein n=1 Tax=Arenimonas daejeonensis TaxID=370777 RepID=UPI0011BDD622|nr:hypothetical protein [Arenimonas daejeonensis]